MMYISPMRKLVGIALILVVLLSCGKDKTEPAPTYTSIDGIWTYTIEGIAVEFELKTVGDVLEIMNTSIVVDDVNGDAAGTLSGSDLPLIQQIRVNANDADLTYPYTVTFTDCMISTNFAIISAAKVEYTYPWGTFNTETGVTISRK